MSTTQTHGGPSPSPSLPSALALGSGNAATQPSVALAGTLPRVACTNPDRPKKCVQEGVFLFVGDGQKLAVISGPGPRTLPNSAGQSSADSLEPNRNLQRSIIWL